MAEGALSELNPSREYLLDDVGTAANSVFDSEFLEWYGERTASSDREEPRLLIRSKAEHVRLKDIPDSTPDAQNSVPTGVDVATEWQDRKVETFMGSYVTRVPSPRSAREQFQLLHQWEGTVKAIDQEVGTFTAELLDLVTDAAADLEADFLISDVSPDDRKLMVPGAVFRWSIGYKCTAGGQIDRVSRIRFVRIPGWRRKEVEEIEEAADAAYQKFARRRE